MAKYQPKEVVELTKEQIKELHEEGLALRREIERRARTMTHRPGTMR